MPNDIEGTRRNTGRWRAVVAIVAPLLLALTACVSESASESPATSGTLTIGTSEEVLTLDMPNYRSTQDIMVGAIGLQPLISMDKDGKLQPLLATSWTQNDQTTYTFKLRTDVTFHDGTKFDAAAVKTFFERAKGELKGQRFYEPIDTITANGEDEVVFKLKRPFSPFLINLSYPTGGIQSPQSLTQYGKEELGRHPVGTGPYQLSEWTGTTITFKRNDTYWNGRPPLDQIVLKQIPDEATRLAALEAGEVDVIQNPPLHEVKAIEGNSDLQVFQGPRAQDYMLAIDHSNPILKNKDVRRAIAMSINKDELIQGVSEGLPRTANGFIPPELVPMDTKSIPYDPEGAKALLASSGHPNGFDMDLWTASGVVPNDVAMVENMQAQLAKVGIRAKVVNKEYASYVDGLARHEHDMSGLAWAHTGAPDSWYRGVFFSTSAANWSAYKNPRADQLIDAAVQAPSYDEAVQIWKELDQLLVDDVAAVPIYFSTYVWAARASVKDFGYHPLGILELNATTVSAA